ncbi:hypothetical protein M9979_06750 [Sphingomonas sp. RP10(2022)]|uniref:Uncharacterized protein n=1 Tax=Sphingomonas liriopis TaxID=2949094 RepID=A0A9X2HRK0_9SPHN|nr:hypothetical protein [Sphingomonas liriopis]MCP3734572.1 hypothetical protein [Sphingomonas liriopis]
MQTVTLEAFFAAAEERARRSGVDAIPTDALRNKGGNRTPNKRALLARAAARAGDGQRSIVSYF